MGSRRGQPLSPELVAQWHPTRNAESPENVAAYANRKAWWVCDHDHEWEALVSHRSNGRGCPYCSGRRAIPGVTDLATVKPELAAQWHPTRNAESPENVAAYANRKAWWVCDHDHEWEASINNRSSNGVGCPYCSGQRAIPGVTDLATVAPELVAQWHPIRNEFGPETVTVSSGKKAWWVCDQGHEWEATIAHRSKGGGCPYCSGHRAIPGVTDLATVNPVLAAQWHPTRNEFSPETIPAGSHKKAWWVCDHGHEWEARIEHRGNGSGCPYCSGRRAIPGVTDLATVAPELVAQWHPTRNEFGPETVTASTDKKAWWVCDHGHEWQSLVYHRSNGVGCPYCSGHRAIPGVTDLATVKPELAAQWHPTRNEFGPETVTVSSNKKAWWLCDDGHEWQASIGSRSGGNGCPNCAGRLLVGFNDLGTVNPELAAQWHPTRNEFGPDEVTAGINKKAWWVCDQGHEWHALIGHRSNGVGCPSCAEYGFKPEQPATLYFLRHRTHQAYKVGITNGTGRVSRIASFESDGWELLQAVEDPVGGLVYAVERAVLRWVRTELGLQPYFTAQAMSGTGGWTETFASAGLPAETVAARIRAEFKRLLDDPGLGE